MVQRLYSINIYDYATECLIKCETFCNNRFLSELNIEVKKCLFCSDSKSTNRENSFVKYDSIMARRFLVYILSTQVGKATKNNFPSQKCLINVTR